MSLYTRLTTDEREQIFLQGNSIRVIAKLLKRSPSTINRELSRYQENQTYSPFFAQSKKHGEKVHFWSKTFVKEP